MKVNVENVKNLINHLEDLQAKGISVIRDGEYTKLYYNLLAGADFHDEETCYCRGITFRGDKVVCCPFFKFGNYGESYADEVDWASARVLEKIDGSLISLWFDNNFWHVSTSKTINAFSASLNMTEITFGDLFAEAIINQGLNLNTLNPNYTYMFELTSPYNKIVVPYEYVSVWHIGTRDNETLEEVEIDIGIKKPKSYPVRTLSECIEAAAALEGIHEGFVVVDKNYNRIKVKTPLYVQLHHTHNNGNISKRDILALIFNKEQEEYLSYFPEKMIFIKHFEDCLNALAETMENEYNEHKEELKQMSRKDAAALIKKYFTVPDYAFTCLYKYELTAWDYLKTMSTTGCLSLIGE